MNKYFAVFKTSFKQEKKTLADSILAVFSFCVIIYIFKQLWEFVYTKGGQTLINGYSLEMMIWYLIVAEVMTYAMNQRAVTRAFSSDIKSGKIAYQLNKPYNYYGYQVATQSGMFVWKLCFLLPTAIIIGLLLLGPIKDFQIYFVFPILLSIFLSCVLTCMFFGAIGLLSFWVEESTPFAWIFQKFIMLLGLFFPPEFFPASVQKAIEFSPVYALISGPSKLVVSFSWQLCLEVLISQIVYLFVALTLGIILFKSGTKKVNINGG